MLTYGITVVMILKIIFMQTRQTNSELNEPFGNTSTEDIISQQNFPGGDDDIKTEDDFDDIDDIDDDAEDENTSTGAATDTGDEIEDDDDDLDVDDADDVTSDTADDDTATSLDESDLEVDDDDEEDDDEELE